jgi:hypothetical protein
MNGTILSPGSDTINSSGLVIDPSLTPTSGTVSISIYYH